MISTAQGKDTGIDVIVVAAGRGSRFGEKKQWKLLRGKPLVAYSLEVFDGHRSVKRVLLGVPPEDLDLGREVLARYAPRRGSGVFAGGAERYETVRKGLELVESELVAIHDAARPFCSPSLLDRLLRAIGDADGAIPALKVSDTVKKVVGGRVVETLDRDEIFLIQTPQLFKTEALRYAYTKLVKDAGDVKITDDASVVERAGGRVVVVEGEPDCFKITTPDDWKRAEGMLAQPRVGFGYDIHRVTRGSGMVLGGVRVDADFSLAGHSDGDALIHAVVDALLGAAGLGDIGEWFPDTDPAYRGADSTIFLRKVAKRVKEKFKILSVDVTVVAQKPRLSPYKERIKKRLAEVMGVSPEIINIKAKTKEGLDATGEGRGVEVYAVALLA